MNTNEIFEIDGEPFQFEWNIFPRHNTVEILREIQMGITTIRRTRRIRRSDHLHVYVQRHRLHEEWKLQGFFSNSAMARDYAKRFPLGHWSFLGPGEEEKWYGTQNDRPEGQWNSSADVMVLQFLRQRTSSLQSFQCTGSGLLEQERWEMCDSLQGDPSNAGLLLRTINSANQPSIYVASEDWCDELTQQIPGQSFSIMEKFIAKVTEQ